MENKKKIIKFYMFLIAIIIFLNNVYATVTDELKPMREDIAENFSILTTIVIIMLGIFAILGIIYKIITDQKVFKNKFSSNKLVRFVEVTLLVVITLLMVYEFVWVNNIYIKCIGIATALFAIYQRASNKNRKWAYTAFVIEVAIYAVAKIFSL